MFGRRLELSDNLRDEITKGDSTKVIGLSSDKPLRAKRLPNRSSAPQRRDPSVVRKSPDETEKNVRPKSLPPLSSMTVVPRTEPARSLTKGRADELAFLDELEAQRLDYSSSHQSGITTLANALVKEVAKPAASRIQLDKMQFSKATLGSHLKRKKQEHKRVMKILKRNGYGPRQLRRSEKEAEQQKQALFERKFRQVEK